MKSKTMKRMVVSTALALTLTAGLSIPAAAANTWQIPEKNIRVQVSDCRENWLQELLQCLQKPSLPDAPIVPDAPEAPVLPDTPQAPESDPASGFEKAVADLVNAQRANHGLSALTFSEKLADGARAKSLDMARNNYFSHNSPTYGSAFDMMKTFGITYKTAGENIAKGYSSPEAVVTAWMNSESHRENILHPGYTAIGVGYIADGGYWTQWFTG